MNKLFKCLSTAFLGVALAVGVGVGVAQGNKSGEVSAAPGDIVTSLSSISPNKTYCLYANFTYKYNKVTYTVDNYLKFDTSETGAVTGKSSGTSVTDCTNFYILSSENDGYYNLKINGTKYFFGSVASNGKIQISESPIDVEISLTNQGVATIKTKDIAYSIQCLKSGSSTNPTNQNFGSYSSAQFVPTLKVATEPSTYSVTYYSNGATTGSAPTDESAYAPNASVTVLDNTGNLSRTGFSFDGWNSNSSGTGTDYPVGSSFTITGNTSLYAKWAAKTLTSVEFTSDSATRSSYYDGEKYSADGLKLLLSYNDLSNETIDVSDADSVVISPEYASLGDTSFSVSATVGSISTTSSKVINVTVEENTMSLTWNDGFTTFEFLKGDEITSTHIGSVKATWKAATQEHEKIQTLVFNTDYAIGLYESKSDTSSSTNTPKIVITSLPYALTLDAKGLFIGVSYNGKISFKSTSLTIKNWRVVNEDTTIYGNLSYPSNVQTINSTGGLVFTVSTSGYTNKENNSIRLGSGSSTGTLTIDGGTNTITKVVVNAKYYNTDSSSISVGGQEVSLTSAYTDYEFVTSAKEIVIKSIANSKRVNVATVTVYSGGIVDVGKTDDCLGLEIFIENNLHMTDYTESKGWCSDSEHHYYATAKTAFNNLNDHQRKLFKENSAYSSEFARLSAWAAANGEVINSSNQLVEGSNISLINVFNDSNSLTILIVTISLVSLTVVGGYFFIRRRKETH